MEINELLENKPDIVLILETACAQKEILLAGHDDYEIIGINALTNNNKEALGKGVAVCFKKTMRIEVINQL